MHSIEIELNDLYQRIVFRSTHSVWMACAVILTFNGFLFLPTRIWEAELAGIGIHSTPQLLGMVLLFILVPMWIISCFIVTQRHSLTLARKVDELVPADQRISRDIIRFPGRRIAIGFVGGMVCALFSNAPSRQLDHFLSGDWTVISVVIGHLMLWVFIGMILVVRLHVVNLFADVGKQVEFSIFEQTSLEPFARVGMLDVVIVVGGLAITAVQSLNVQFRLENYLTSILVLVPIGFALLFRPMWSLHKRLRRRKRELLAEVTGEIGRAGESTDPESIRTLEFLLQRRDRVKALNTWPLDLGILSRLAFYVLIPPLAWAGAALMEVAVDLVLGI